MLDEQFDSIRGQFQILEGKIKTMSKMLEDQKYKIGELTQQRDKFKQEKNDYQKKLLKIQESFKGIERGE